MSLKRLLYIAPHLSTGGMPKFLQKKIEALKNVFEIFVIEWENVSNDFIIQKTAIRNLLPKNHFLTLKSDKQEILNLIKKINPDIIHFEEIPEYFMPLEISKEIYGADRTYSIFETTHSSDLNPAQKILKPDKFLFVCPFSAVQYANLGVPSEIIEFPIDNVAIDKDLAKKQLNFDPNYKHVVIVGLFTPRKNQGYAFKIAELLQDFNIQFHFIGNQAGNFQHYWAPLLANKPANCILWGERSDVSTFLCAADLSLFPSEGRNGDRELNPLIIKESLEHKLPILMYNLDVYLGKYDNHPSVHFLTGQPNQDAQNLLSILNPSGHNALATILEAYISVWYNRTDNKIYLRSNYVNTLKFAHCIIKEIDSEATIYFFDNVVFTPNIELWALPINGFSFWEDQYCNGFLIEFLNEQKEIVLKKEIRLRPPTAKVKCPGLDPFDCSYINYREFFNVGIYDHLDFSDLETVVDVGASVGLFTKYITEKGAKTVFALEPIKKAYDSCVAVNPKARVFNIALDVKSGNKDIYFTNDNTTVSRFIDDLPLTERYQFNKKEVMTLNWKDFCAVCEIERVSLLKMDIEGHEYQIFKHLDGNDLAKINQIILEFHLSRNGEIKNIIKQLEENGFKTTIHKQSTKQLGSPDDQDGILFATR